jgi:hypothetical protein
MCVGGLIGGMPDDLEIAEQFVICHSRFICYLSLPDNLVFLLNSEVETLSLKSCTCVANHQFYHLVKGILAQG